MGERLNLEIAIDGEDICNVYFHWSAYAYAALELSKKVGEAVQTKMKVNNLPATLVERQKYIVELLMEVGFSGLKEGSFNYLTKEFPNSNFVKATNRNEGLIAVTEEEMNSTRDWQEGGASISIMLDGSISFYNGLIYNLGDEIEEVYVDADVEDEEEFEENHFALDEMDDIDELTTIDVTNMNLDELNVVFNLFETELTQYFKVDNIYYTYV